MKGPVFTGAAAAACCLASCAPAPLFPPEALEGFDPQAQFGIFNPEADTYLTGKVVQVGGQMLRITKTDEGLLIMAQELPLTHGAVPRPADEAKSTGSFVILYQGPVDAAGLQRGNKFTLIGEMKGTQTITLGDIRKPVPYLRARCLHVWKTGTYAIADFPNIADGYYPLQEETYCVPRAP